MTLQAEKLYCRNDYNYISPVLSVYGVLELLPILGDVRHCIIFFGHFLSLAVKQAPSSCMGSLA